MTTPDVFIDSFGARRQDTPPPRHRAAVLGINFMDVRLNPPTDDPNLAEVVAQQTGQDAAVRDYVMATPGAARITNDAVHELTELCATAHSRPVKLLVNCW